MNQATLLSRVKRLLPSEWFGNGPTPVLDIVMSGTASTLNNTYAFLLYLKNQTRLGTATGIFLDVAGLDFLGRRVRRRVGEQDTAWRARIKAEILRPRVTRSALIKALTDLTGKAPWLFEPANTQDTGGWDTGYFAFAGSDYSGSTGGAWDQSSGWDTNSVQFDQGVVVPVSASPGAGGWGDTNLPYQLFIKAYRPGLQGVPNSSGFDSTLGGYDTGSIQWIDPSMTTGLVTDPDIYNTINLTKAAGVIAWTQLI